MVRGGQPTPALLPPWTIPTALQAPSNGSLAVVKSYGARRFFADLTGGASADERARAPASGAHLEASTGHS